MLHHEVMIDADDFVGRHHPAVGKKDSVTEVSRASISFES